MVHLVFFMKCIFTHLRIKGILTGHGSKLELEYGRSARSGELANSTIHNISEKVKVKKFNTIDVLII